MKKAKIKIVPIPLTTPSRAARRTPESASPKEVGFEAQQGTLPYKYSTIPLGPAQRPSSSRGQAHCATRQRARETRGDCPTHPRLPARSAA